jgi:hypothetical protein
VWADDIATSESWFLVTADTSSQALAVSPVSGLPPLSSSLALSSPASASSVRLGPPVVVPGRADCLFFTHTASTSWSVHCWAGALLFEEVLAFPAVPGYTSYSSPSVVDVGQDGVLDVIVLALDASTGQMDTLVFPMLTGCVCGLTVVGVGAWRGFLSSCGCCLKA